MLGNYERGEPHSVTVLDYCSIHTSARVKQLIEATGAVIVYSAPCCPEVIPIENMFHQWKAYLKRYKSSFEEDWCLVHHHTLASITPQQGLYYSRNTTLVDLVDYHPLSESYQKKQRSHIISCGIVVSILGSSVDED